MSTTFGLACPICGSVLVTTSMKDGDEHVGDPRGRDVREFECLRCALGFPRLHGLLDLRTRRDAAIEPAPLAACDFARAFEAEAESKPFKSALEELLLALDEHDADRLMQVLREASGTWFPLLRESSGEVLFLGSALSGSVTPFASVGFFVTVLDLSPERARFGDFRNRAHSPGRTRMLIGGDGTRLPFVDRRFDVVVRDDGIALEQAARAGELAECRRVCRGEVVLIANNRLAYKRSRGRRNDFHVPGPFEFLRAAIVPVSGERTLRGHRSALLGPGFPRARTFALYPHAHDFTHVVALDQRAPNLTIGPMERKNRWKLAARSLGLFPIFTPSFALFGASTIAERRAPRIERMLAQIATQVGEPVPHVAQLFGTRGNTAILHTEIEGAREETASGRWTLHVPLCPKNVPQVERHYRALEQIRACFPSVPVPEPLFLGRADGVYLTCERRARGWTAPQFNGDRLRIARMLGETAQHFAMLVVRRPARLTDSDFEEQIGVRFELVMRHAAVDSTIANLARLRDEMRERLIGRAMPRVLYHADLRAKHVQVDLDGHVVGYLDWGTTEQEGLPYFDLLHLVIHQRKQEDGSTAGAAWRLVRDRHALRDDERAALDGYARAVGIDGETARAIEALYPVLVAAMAEKNWDFSRPRWLHMQFGI